MRELDEFVARGQDAQRAADAAIAAATTATAAGMSSFNSQRESLDSIAPEHRRAAQLEKSDRLFRLACHIQDELDAIGIYHGDGKLLDAKIKIYEACEKARTTCYKVRYGGKR